MPYTPSILQKRCAQANVMVLAAATLLLVWMIPGIQASPIQIRPSGEQYTLRAGKLPRRRHLTEKDRQAIIQDYGLKEDAELSVQSISQEENTIIVDSKEYSLNGMSKISVRTKSFTSVVDGISMAVPEDRMYYAMDDQSNELKVRAIQDASTSNFVEIRVLHGEQDASLIALESDEHEDGLFVTISPSDYLEDPYLNFDGGGRPIVVDKTGDSPNGDPVQRKLQVQDPCGTGNNPYFHIEVAITYDSTFCNLQNSQTGAAILDGSAAQAIAKIEDIVFMASVNYENPNLCATLRLAHTEGTCSTGSEYDIYRTAIDTKNVYGILDEYESKQKSNTAHRDVAHLFTGTRFTDGSGITNTVSTIGLANTGLSSVNGVLCNRDFMYGIDSMGARKIQSITYNPTLLLQSILFAHELGHNCGAGHNDNEPDIMNSYLTEAGGFSTASISTMRTFFQKTNGGQTGYFTYLNNCLADPDSANPAPAPSPTADDPKGDEPAPTSCGDSGFFGQIICWIASFIKNLLGLS